MLVEIRYKIGKLILPDDKCPFDIWFESLSTVDKHRVSVRLSRLELGNFGEHKSLGSRLWELKFRAGAAYRIYYALTGKKIILLVGAGDKSSQKKDIALAKSRLKSLEKQ